jgi:putative hydrolase of the HAD superfamily
LPPAAQALGIPRLTEALLEALRFRPFPEVPAALERLREQGAALVVVSNWDVSLHDQLEATGHDRLVVGAVSSAELGGGKPNPAIYTHALEVAGAPATEALMVGDSLDTDVAGALAAGLRAVLVDRWGTAPDPPPVPTIPSLAELPGLVGSLA